jgi:hypothetical protein
MPTRSAQGDDSIMKKDHLAALMKQQADMMKQQAAMMKKQAALAMKQAALAKRMEEINERIKRMVMEESTSPLISVKIEEEEVIDLTSSPNVKEEDIATSDDTKIKLEDVEVENVSTHSTTVASNIATAPTITTTNTTTPTVTRVTKGKRNMKSLKMSPIQLRQALTTIPGNKLFSPLRRESTDSRHTPPKANSTLRDLDPIWLAAENNTTGKLMHTMVKAKLSSSQSESDNCIYNLKLYRRYDNGRTQLVMHDQASGHVKFTVMIASMYDLEYTIVRRKMIFGVISFISKVRAEVIEKFMLRVNHSVVYDLYWKLVELGAHEKVTV